MFKEYIFFGISRIKLLFEPSLRRVDDTKGTLIDLFENFKGKKIINFQKIKLYFNSIFCREFKEIIFVEISRIKLLFEPSLGRVDDTKGVPLSTCLRISREKKFLINKNLYSNLIVYYIESLKSIFSLEYLE